MEDKPKILELLDEIKQKHNALIDDNIQFIVDTILSTKGEYIRSSDVITMLYKLKDSIKR